MLHRGKVEAKMAFGENAYVMDSQKKHVVFAKQLDDGQSAVVFDIGGGRLFAAVVELNNLEVTVPQLVGESTLTMTCKFVRGQITEHRDERAFDRLKELAHLKKLEESNGTA